MVLRSRWKGLASSLACIAGWLFQAAAPAQAAGLAEEARRIVGAGQGVQVETADGRVLVSEAGARAVHPASVSKIPTTLALLRELGPDYRFATVFLADGSGESDTIEGPLVVRASGDPYFVDENAILVAQALRKTGLRKVSGDLVIDGKLLFNWKADNLATRLRQALEGNVSSAAWEGVRATEIPSDTNSATVPRLEFAPLSRNAIGSETPLVTHQSQPLHYMLKALNGYSNNILAWFANAVGGIQAVEKRIREELPLAYREELVLGDGAGAHAANRMSPRATVTILRALEKELAQYGLDLTSVMPVAGVDEGTLKKRLLGPNGESFVVAKTGTYGDYGACALAGALLTKNGLVYFAILNRGVPILEARRRQDAYVRVLMAELDALPLHYQRNTEPAFTRAEVTIHN